MLRILLFLSLFSLSAFRSMPTEPTVCSCSNPSNLQKTGQTTSSLTCGWNAPANASQFKLYYIRREDGYTSGYFYTSGSSYTFSGLSSGHYTFYVQTECGDNGTSGYIGIEDVIGV